MERKLSYSRIYGDWEYALYQYDFKKLDVAKDKLRKDSSRTFKYKE
ncbi:hypothetical protein [Bacillus cereus]|nr:hypothetical protein [Bacillus cereus]